MNAQPDTVSILIPDGESYIMLGVLRCLSDVKGIRLFVISNNRNTAMRYSRHITSFIYCTKSASVDEWFNLINKLVKKHDIDVILPVFENASQAFLRHRDMFCCDKLLLVPETLDALEVARDKWLLSRHLEKQDLDGPGTFQITEFLNHRSSKAEFYFPLLLKPTAETGDGKGIIKFDAYDDLKRYLKEHTIDPSYILQEYIEGYDLGCNVLCKNGEILAYTIQKGTIFTNRPFSPQVGLKITKDNEVYQRISKLMKSLNWNGVANIDMRYDVKRKKYLILEINTRFWYTVLASSKAGVNFPWLYCLTVMGISFERPSYSEIEYVNNRGLYKMLFEKPWKLMNVRELWTRTPIRYQVGDPLMTTYHILWAFRKIVKGKFSSDKSFD